YEATIWLGIMAPKGTPPAIVQSLNEGIRAAVNAAETKALWAKQGAVPMSMSPDEFGTFLRADIDKWAKVIDVAKMRPE
ncbi:MAG: transporter, partial [Enterovirga sp.]|nr:transporter [Enterovirga sp.]